MLYKTKVAELRYENDGQVTLAKIKKKKIKSWSIPALNNYDCYQVLF